ncbi:MAG: MarR family winged helix-turn-helix transcriptional regulator [Rhodoblastus sp.]
MPALHPGQPQPRHRRGFRGEDHANRFGLTGPQWRVLAVLGEAEGPLSGAEAARRAAVNTVMGHRAIEGLLEDDLVVQRENAADRRKSSLVLSRRGAMSIASSPRSPFRSRTIFSAFFRLKRTYGPQVDCLQIADSLTARSA